MRSLPLRGVPQCGHYLGIHQEVCPNWTLTLPFYPGAIPSLIAFSFQCVCPSLGHALHMTTPKYPELKSSTIPSREHERSISRRGFCYVLAANRHPPPPIKTRGIDAFSCVWCLFDDPVFPKGTSTNFWRASGENLVCRPGVVLEAGYNASGCKSHVARSEFRGTFRHPRGGVLGPDVVILPLEWQADWSRQVCPC